MAKKATTRGRKNARLGTNFKAETQAVPASAGADDNGRKSAQQAEASAKAETDQPGGAPTAAGTDQGNGAAGGAASGADIGITAGEAGAGADASGGVVADGVTDEASKGNEAQQDPAAPGSGDPTGGDVQSAAADDAAGDQAQPAADGEAGGGEAETVDPVALRLKKARASGVNSYLGSGHFTGKFMQAIEWDPDAPHFVEAAAFVLADRNSPAHSIPIHLALKKLGGSMKPEPVDVMLWGVFRSTLLAVHDHLQAIDDAETAKAASPAPAGGMPLDRAMTAQAEPLTPSAMRPRV